MDGITVATLMQALYERSYYSLAPPSPFEDCPQEKCVGKVRRLLGTGAGVIFKGSGFYQTDYRSDSYKKGATKDSSSNKKTESSRGEGGAKE